VRFRLDSRLRGNDKSCLAVFSIVNKTKNSPANTVRAVFLYRPGRSVFCKEWDAVFCNYWGMQILSVAMGLLCGISENNPAAAAAAAFDVDCFNNFLFQLPGKSDTISAIRFSNVKE
jgi:hypothetical protein